MVDQQLNRTDAPSGETEGSPQPTLSRALVLLMAVATGVTVANLYYAQPLLHAIGTTFGVGPQAAALIVTCTQVGYAAGLLLIVPLGDIRPRRSLIVTLFLLSAVALVVSASAPSLWLFEIASVAVGCTAVAAQIMVPFAADLAPETHRGRAVAQVMSGLLLGILLARTVSGLVATAFGWRAIYWTSLVVMVGFAGLLSRTLPHESARPRRPYPQLIASTLALLVHEPLLRRRALHGACAFASFSVLWTSLAFLLSGAPYHYSNAVIGLFGLAGAAGVIAANFAGKLADAQRGALSTAVAGVALSASFALLYLGHSSVAALIVGIVVLDVGTQGMQITNQAVIYSTWPNERSRVNSAYMIVYFCGGALGSLGSGAIYAADGWSGVCILGAATGALSIVTALVDRLAPARAPTA